MGALKIAQVVCVFPPYRGGIGTMAYNHARSLAREGHEVVVFTPRYDALKPEHEDREGFAIRRLDPSVTYGNAAFCPSLLKQLEGFDVIHLHYPCFGMAELVWWYCRFVNKKQKLVVTYHMDVVGGFTLRWFFALYRLFMLPRIMKRADKVIVTSNDYAAHSHIAKWFYKRPKTFHEIPPEVDTVRFSPGLEANDLAREYAIDRVHEKVLLFVGGLDRAHYFKGINFLIDSFEVLQRSTKHRLKLIIVGEGDLKPAYRARVVERQLDDQVFFADQVGDGDLPRYYNLADLVVLPSTDKSEAFGIVLIEAMACGTPVIASNLPGVRTAMGEAGITFTVHNEGELAAKLDELLTDHDRWHEMSKKAREIALARYDTRVIARKLTDVYEDLSD